MPRVALSAKAGEDLCDIWSFIAEDNFNAADRLLDAFEIRMNRLAEYPGMGQDRSSLLDGLRSWTEGNYLIFYLPMPDGIEVVRILHGAREIENLF